MHKYANMNFSIRYIMENFCFMRYTVFGASINEDDAKIRTLFNFLGGCLWETWQGKLILTFFRQKSNS